MNRDKNGRRVRRPFLMQVPERERGTAFAHINYCSDPAGGIPVRSSSFSLLIEQEETEQTEKTEKTKIPEILRYLRFLRLKSFMGQFCLAVTCANTRSKLKLELRTGIPNSESKWFGEIGRSSLAYARATALKMAGWGRPFLISA
ncbi:hypothetical protein LLG95_00695 [bacterium]|nr:hypothetical protein [bacterium]